MDKTDLKGRWPAPGFEFWEGVAWGVIIEAIGAVAIIWLCSGCRTYNTHVLIYQGSNSVTQIDVPLNVGKSTDIAPRVSGLPGGVP